MDFSCVAGVSAPRIHLPKSGHRGGANVGIRIARKRKYLRINVAFRRQALLAQKFDFLLGRTRMRIHPGRHGIRVCRIAGKIFLRDALNVRIGCVHRGAHEARNPGPLGLGQHVGDFDHSLRRSIGLINRDEFLNGAGKIDVLLNIA